jgi:hypothetical protein
VVLLGGALVLWAGQGTALRAEPTTEARAPLTAAEIARRMVAHARAPARSRQVAEYGYTKRTRTERLDEKGHVKELQEKLLKFQGGLGTVVEMKVNGRPVPAAELQKQETEMAEKRQQLTRKAGPRSDYWEMFLTPDLTSKYVFALAGEQTVNGRSAYVLAFHPRPGLPVDQLADRLMNQLTGKLWVDTEDFEIARAELSLQNEATLWGGVLANLKKFDYTAERVRLPDGTWFNHVTTGEFTGRKLIEPFHVRTRTESTDFHRTGVRAGLEVRG